MKLPNGLYEQLITREISAALGAMDVDARSVEQAPLDPVDSYDILSRHVYTVLNHVLRALPENERLDQQVGVCNSPTTMYKDYAVSPELFHWESQNATSQASPTGQRYINHRQRGSNILLFVRRTAKLGSRTAPYMFLGLADHVSHERERPIAFVWRLRRPMPADFFRGAKVAAG